MAALPEFKEVIGLIRALLQSAPSDGLYTHQLLKDYREIEGVALPFAKFGYNSVEELLKASGEFIPKRTPDGIIIIPKENKDSAHINFLVQQQKATKKKKKATSSPAPRRLIHSPTTNNQRQKWRGSAYTDLYSRTPNLSVKKAVIPSLMDLIVEPPTTRSHRSYGPTTQSFVNGSGQQNVPFARKSANQEMRPITKQSNINNDNGKFNYNSNKIDPPMPSTNTSISNGHGVNKIHSRIAANNNDQTTSSTVTPITTTTSTHAPLSRSTSTNGSAGTNNAPRPSTVNNRLTKYQNYDDETMTRHKATVDQSIARRNLDSDVVDFVTTLPASKTGTTNSKATIKTQTKTIQFDESLISTEALSKFCQQKEYAQPVYKCFPNPRTHKFQCRVTVNDVIYSTYPEESETELDARVQAARLAIQQLKEVELRVKYAMCMDGSKDLAFKIQKCIESYASGVFLKKIPELFQERFELTLPENWFDTITEYPQMFAIDDGINDKIISPNVTGPVVEVSPAAPHSITRTIQNIVPDELVLPWNEKHWNVYITNPVSTVEVWARIIGPEYSGKMDSLLTDIELELYNNKKVADTIEIQRIYLVMISECWYRVRIDRKDPVQNRALCFFIDNGDEDWYPVDQIYVCDPKFISFPAQAFCFTLYGLEDFAENPNARQQVDDHLSGKSLIAEIITSKDEYVANDKSSDLEARVATNLYDTSSDDDIQLNELILEKICEQTDAPQLQRGKINTVLISHISDTGDIYCQLHQFKSSLHYITKLIHQLTTGAFDFAPYRYVYGEASGMYLIYDKSENKWYRAAILSGNASGSTEQCKCIDYGMIKTIPREHIYRLDSLSAALNMYPAQAILVRMNEMPTYNANVIARLRGLLYTSSPAMVQVVTSATIPLVNIYKRLEPSKVFCKINETIRMEQELENSSDLLFDDSFNSSEYTPNIKTKATNSPIKRNIVIGLPLCEVPSQDDYFNCLVTMASNPSNFKVRPYKSEIEFNKMTEQLQHYCRGNNVILTEDTIQKGECYAGLNQDAVWCRVIIDRILPAGDVLVYNCDWGDITMLAMTDLRPLDNQFLKLPQLAIQAKLYGIRPNNNDWSTDDVARFQELTVSRRFASEIKAVNGDQNKYELELILIDVSTERDIIINNILIEEKRAH